jgi:acetyl-CoA acyltransferase
VLAAYEQGLHDGFVVEVEGVRRDESLRPGTTVQKLAELKPAFTPNGSVTAGNASPINDGATAIMVGDAAMAEQLGVEPLGRVLAAATTATEPDRFSVAPVDAIGRVLARIDRAAADIDLWEINEAFAAMVLSTLRGLPDVDPERVNVNGGAIAIGHPLGASAPRVVVDLCRELRRRGGGIGVAAACIGVGQGQAVVVEVP